MQQTGKIRTGIVMLVRVDESQAMLADDLFRCVAEQALDRRAGIQGYAACILHDGCIRAVLDQRAKALLALLQRFFGLLAFGYVAQICHDGLHVRFVQPIGSGNLQPTPRSVFVPHAALHGHEFPRFLQ